MTEVTKDVEVARLVQPKFLSLVGSPANQIAFKVIRDDNGETTMTAPHISRKRTRRSDSLVSIEFGLATTDDQIKQAMADWGISDYKVEEDGDKRLVRCSDAGDAETMKINVGNGVSATILKPISQRSDGSKPHLAVSAIEFAADYFPDAADISAWCTRNNIDFSNLAVENGAQQTVARRSVKVAEGEETRKIEVDNGVQFVVARADSQDIPGDFIVVINDAAYGSWGWGQLDFAATLADKQFCNAAEDAIYTLRNVAERIIFYSDLPISVRKDLITSAAGQFADYIVTLMDALPARVVVANRSILEKEKLMSKDKGQDGQAVERQDQTDVNDKATVTGGEATGSTDNATGAAPTGDSISRSDVEKMIGDALGGLSAQIAELKGALVAPAAEPAQRSDGTSGEADDKSGAAEAAGSLQEVLRSIKDLGEVVKGVGERVQSLESSTVVRSDATDDKQQATQRKDIFKGMFGKRDQA